MCSPIERMLDSVKSENEELIVSITQKELKVVALSCAWWVCVSKPLGEKVDQYSVRPMLW